MYNVHIVRVFAHIARTSAIKPTAENDKTHFDSLRQASNTKMRN